MGPETIKFSVFYENEMKKIVTVHITKDQDEADGFIIAARIGKALYPYSMIVRIQFMGVVKEENEG